MDGRVALVNGTEPQRAGANRERARSRARFALKGAVGLGLLAWLLLKTDLGELRESFEADKAEHLVYSILAFFLLIVLQAGRLHVLIRDRTIRFSTTLRMVLVGSFFNNFLPSSMGGDAYKIAYLRAGGRGWGSSTALVLFDRLAGFAIVIPVGVACLLLGVGGSEVVAVLGDQRWLRLPGPWIAAALAALVAATSFFWFLRSSRIAARLLAGMRAGWSGLREVSPRAHLAVIGLSLASFAARVLRFVFYAEFFGLGLSFGELTLVVVILNLASMLPLTVGGLGLQEGAIAAGLSLFGIPLGLGTAVGILNRAAIWVVALAGGLTWLVTGRRLADGARPPRT